jgi:predicted nuclease of predicted toxin-antitoxin system
LFKFLVDECAGKRLATLLVKAGYDVILVGDSKPSSSDEEVLSKAEGEERILITDDKDFGKLIFRSEKPSSGVILIRTTTTNPEERFKLLIKTLESTNPKGKFIIVREKAVKVRKIK